MFFLFSGEGITDLGVGKSDAVVCQGHDYFVGPMAIMADHVVQGKQGYSIVDAGCCGYVSERNLSNRAAELKAAKKALGLPGKKRAKETRYFFNNARVLSRIAKEKQTGLKDDVVAVLFRDGDGTASAGRGLWDDKRKSMLDGFDEEKFSKGVPMIPKPQSEAWLICALKKTAYQRCAALEGRSGKPMKSELAKLLGEAVTPELLCQKVRNRSVDVDRIKMPSFKAFRDRLEMVIG